MARSYEEQTRIDLAATFRIIAHLGMHEAVANHFSAALSADGKKFLLPCCRSPSCCCIS